MENSTEQKNKEAIVKLVKSHFDLDGDSFSRFEEEINDKYVDQTYREILGENAEDLRRYVPVPEPKRHLFDKGWTAFKNRFCHFCEKHKITYSDFRKGKIKIDKQEVKLYKALKKYYTEHFGSVINAENWVKENMEFVGSFGLPKDCELFLVLSLNFADWFLCSTAEKWSSCLNLESDYYGSFWTGLPGTIVDRNRAMAYATTKEKKEYNGIVVDKIMTRSWVLLDEVNRINTLRYYPISFLSAEMLNDSFVTDAFKDIDSDFFTKHTIKPLFFKNGFSSFIYQDKTRFGSCRVGKVSLEYIAGGSYQYIDESGNIQNGDLFSYGGGLRRLISEDISILDTPGPEVCENCGLNVIYNDYTFDGCVYCENCFNDLFFTCDDCGEVCRWDESHNIATESSTICRYCFEHHYEECCCCGEYFHTDQSFYVSSVEKWFCEDCLDEEIKKGNLVKCESCEEIFDKNIVIYLKDFNDYLCKKCYNEEIDKPQYKFDFVA